MNPRVAKQPLPRRPRFWSPGDPLFPRRAAPALPPATRGRCPRCYRPRRVLPSWRCVRPTRAMANGSHLLDGGGYGLLDGDGYPVLDPTPASCKCCVGFLQLRRCTNNALVDLWIPADSFPGTPLPWVVQIGDGGPCYKVNGPVRPDHGRMVTEDYYLVSGCFDGTCAGGCGCGGPRGYPPAKYRAVVAGIDMGPAACKVFCVADRQVVASDTTFNGTFDLVLNNHAIPGSFGACGVWGADCVYSMMTASPVTLQPYSSGTTPGSDCEGQCPYVLDQVGIVMDSANSLHIVIFHNFDDDGDHDQEYFPCNRGSCVAHGIFNNDGRSPRMTDLCGTDSSYTFFNNNHAPPAGYCAPFPDICCTYIGVGGSVTVTPVWD